MASGKPASTTKRARSATPAGLPSEFELSILSGLDVGVVRMLDGTLPRTLAGTSPACTLQLRDPCVSRRHVALEIVGDTLHVLDLGSTNGTFINGVRIRDASLCGGETMYLGDTTVAVRRKGPIFAELPEATHFGALVGESLAMRKLFPLIQRISAEDSAVLVEGEPGAGKELLAEEIHRASPRRDAPFVVVSCAGTTETAIARELGSTSGPLAQAKGGTLFIDELTVLDASAQAILLQTIERGDPRVIAATTDDLDACVEAGRFDEELLRRLAVSRVELPPLRERRGDIVLLARRFWVELGGQGQLPGDFLARLARYKWPGNVTELRAEVLERVVSSGTADPGAAEPDFAALVSGDIPFPRAKRAIVALFERRYITNLLAKHEGNVVRAATASGVALRYFQLLRAKRR